MRFKVDENLPEEAAQLLRRAGYDASTVLGQNMGGESDPDLSLVCQREQRALITLDLGFADIRTYPPKEYFGLLVLRLKRQDKMHVVGTVERLLPMQYRAARKPALDRRRRTCEDQRLDVDQRRPDKAMQSWEKLLHPPTLRTNLILASLYLSAYELFRSSIVNRIQRFFIYSFMDEDGKPIVDERYNEVKQLHRDILRASCLWLQQNGALSAEDVAEIDVIRQHRNQIAHELPELLSDVDRDINLDFLQSIQRLLRKTEIWWIRDVGMTINEDFDGVEVADEDINPRPVIMLNEIIRIALDNVANR